MEEMNLAEVQLKCFNGLMNILCFKFMTFITQLKSYSIIHLHFSNMTNDCHLALTPVPIKYSKIYTTLHMPFSY